MFYQHDTNLNRYVKKIPNNLRDYLTPLALAIWYNGSKIPQESPHSNLQWRGGHIGPIGPIGPIGGKDTVRIATNSFTYEDNLLLCKILKDKYNLECSVMESWKEHNKGYVLYIYKNSYPLFKQIVKEHIWI
jgi:hypothetical protein